MEKFFIKKQPPASSASSASVDNKIILTTPLAAATTPATAPRPSDEQAVILELFRNNANIWADCVAGSGKTTTIIFLALAFPEKQFIQITYNAQLKLEVRAKINALGIKNLEIHTYHSLWVRYYNVHGHTDDVIRRGIDANCKSVRTIPCYDAIIVDEVQDMTILYYCLIHKFMKDVGGGTSSSSSRNGSGTNSHLQLVTLGDSFQSIYKFKGSDHRFLTLSNDIWGKPFVRATLSTSYRITNQIAHFVNDIMIGADSARINAVKDGTRVDYIISNTYTSYNYIADRIEKKLYADKLNPDDIFVLCPSLTSSGSAPPSRKLENELVKRGIPCYYPTSDERKLDEEIIRGKVVFSTFHQSKGRERKYVLVYGFDQSYFTFFAKDANPYVCPETLYVAVTRAKEELVVMHDNRFQKLSFIKPSLFEMSFAPHSAYLNVYRLQELRAEAPVNEARHAVNVTDLTKFIKEENIKLLTDIANAVYTTVREPVYDLNIPSKLKIAGAGAGAGDGAGAGAGAGADAGGDGADLYEDVSDINGIVIPAIYESESQNCESTIEKQIHQLYDNLCRQQNKHHFLQHAYSKLNKYGSMQTMDDYIRMGIMYISLKEEIYHKIAQINRHDWLDRGLIQPCFTFLSSLIDTASALYERGLECVNTFPDFGKVHFIGRLDVFDAHTVFEIKCTQTLSLEHKMQLLVYAWMWKQQTDSFYSATPRDFKLVNIRTGEILRLDIGSRFITDAIHILLENRYGKKDVLNDAEFVDMCARARDRTVAARAGGATIATAIILPAPCKSSNKCLILDEDDPINPT